MALSVAMREGDALIAIAVQINETAGKIASTSIPMQNA